MIAGRADGRVWIKICGLSSPDHVHVAADAGADAVGVVFHDGSSRDVTFDQARGVVAAAEAHGILTIAVTVDHTIGALAELVRVTGVSGVQLHGDEPPALIAELRDATGDLVILRARHVQVHDHVWSAFESDGADAILIDTHVPGVAGGTGRPVAWQKATADAPVIVAGGLDPDNVVDAIRVMAPFGVDVSSGVERAPGQKDPKLIEAFIERARSAP